jgi:hypothetical protein
MFAIKTKYFSFITILMGLILICIVCSGYVLVIMNQTNDGEISTHLSQLRRNANYTPFFSNFLRYPDYRINPIIHHEIFDNYPAIIPLNAKIIAGTSISLNNNDSISITYPYNKKNMVNCMKITAPMNHMVECILFVTKNHELVCANLKENYTSPNEFDVIVEGVEAMRIRYGEDTDRDGVANRYVAADYPGLSLARVVNIKISLLLRTSEKMNLMLNSKYYVLQDAELGPFKDHYMRKVYTVTVPISGVAAEQLKNDDSGVERK